MKASKVSTDVDSSDERRAFSIPRFDSAIKWFRTALKKKISSSLQTSLEFGTDLVRPDVCLTSPITCGFPRASSGGPISKTAKIFDIMSHTLVSAKYLPGQILAAVR